MLLILFTECFTDHYRVNRHGVDSVRRPSCLARHRDIAACPIGSKSDDADRYQFKCFEESVVSLGKFFARTVKSTNRHNFSINDRQQAIHERWTGCQEHNAVTSTIRTTDTQVASGHAAPANFPLDGSFAAKTEKKARRSAVLPHKLRGKPADGVNSLIAWISADIS